MWVSASIGPPQCTAPTRLADGASVKACCASRLSRSNAPTRTLPQRLLDERDRPVRKTHHVLRNRAHQQRADSTKSPRAGHDGFAVELPSTLGNEFRGIPLQYLARDRDSAVPQPAEGYLQPRPGLLCCHFPHAGFVD